jgi:hypothetical protein
VTALRGGLRPERHGPVAPDRDHLGPRPAGLFRACARANADGGYEDIEIHGDKPVAARGDDWVLFQRFPPVTFHMGSSWRLITARSFDDLADDVGAGRLPRPRSICEEIALILTIEDCVAALRDPTMNAQIAELPGCSTDEAWRDRLGELVDRRRVARLFRIAFTAPHGAYGPDQWLVEFGGTQTRDSRRGFRRWGRGPS